MKFGKILYGVSNRGATVWATVSFLFCSVRKQNSKLYFYFTCQQKLNFTVIEGGDDDVAKMCMAGHSIKWVERHN